MKKILSLVLCLMLLAVCSSLIAPIVTKGTQVSAAAADEIKVNANEARFLNMLNHNFVYNADFEDADTMVNQATLKFQLVMVETTQLKKQTARL